MSYYSYKVTNKQTGEYYFGSRTTKAVINRNPEDDLWIRYFTSSDRVKKQIEQYGKDAFTAEVVQSFDSVDMAYAHEQISIYYHIKDPLCLNERYIDPLRLGSYSYEKAIAQISAALKGKTRSEEHKANISAAKKGETHSEEHNSKVSLANKGKTHSEESKAKMSAAKKGKPGRTHSEESKVKMSEAHKGKIKSEETKAKMSAAQQTRKENNNEPR